MDTFKDRQVLDELYNRGEAPWEVWKTSKSEHSEHDEVPREERQILHKRRAVAHNP
jgi:hypothetical protein